MPHDFDFGGEDDDVTPIEVPLSEDVRWRAWLRMWFWIGVFYAGRKSVETSGDG